MKGVPQPFAAFIRAIGPETHRVMPQADLCKACEKLGLHEVKSFIASGNLHFVSGKSAAECSMIVSKAIGTFGLERPVFIRSASQLQSITLANPFPERPVQGAGAVSISLFGERLDAQLVEELLKWPGPERIVVRPEGVYVDYNAGQGRSKIAPPVIERKLKAVGTARNLSTIIKMQALLEAVNGI